MEKQKKKQKGITLISLVITIIVMLILAGVALNAAIGDNGILSQTQTATLVNNLALIEEKKQFTEVDRFFGELNTIVTEKASRYDIDSITKTYIKESQGAIGNYAIDWDYVYYIDFEKAEISKDINLGDINEGQNKTQSLIYDTKGNNIIYNKGITIDGTKYYTYAHYKGIGTESGETEGSGEVAEEILLKNKIFTSGNDQTYLVKENGDTYSLGKVDDINLIGMDNYIDITDEFLKTDYKLQEGDSLCLGYKYSYIKRADGKIYSIGENSNGELGLGHTNSMNYFTEVNIDNVKEIPRTTERTMFFLKENGDVYACGKNYYQYSNGDYYLIDSNGDTYYTTPVKVPGIENVEEILWVTDYCITVKKTDGTIWAWGSNCFGQFGEGTATNNKVPTELTIIEDIASNLGTTVKTVQTRISTIALLANGDIYTCGYGYYACIGNGSLSNRYTFTTTPILTNVKDIYLGDCWVYAILNDGTTYGWGGNGVIGTEASEEGAVTSVPTPSRVPVDNIIYINQKIALTTDGSLYMLGLNKNKEFNTKICENMNIKEVYSNKGTLVYAIESDNVICSYGSTDKNSLIEDYAYRLTAYKTIFQNVDSIYATSSNLIYKTKDNNFLGLGSNAQGCLGLGNTNRKTVPQLLNIAGISNINKFGITGLGGTYNISCFLDSGNNLYMSGVGEYGLSSLYNEYIFDKVTLEIDGSVEDVIIKGDGLFIVNSEGDMYAIGANINGQMGNGEMTHNIGSLKKIEHKINDVVVDFREAKQITEGYNYTYVLMNDGSIYCWGDNRSGQLGLNTVSSGVPTITEMTYFSENNINIEKIIPGTNFVVFLTDTNEIYTLGNNDYGQLGNGTTTSSLVPVKVNIDNVAQVITGNQYVIVVKNNGDVYSFGKNDYGQCGTRTLENLLVPTKATELMF